MQPYDYILLQLSLINGIGPRFIHNVCAKIGLDNLASLYDMSVHDVSRTLNISYTDAHTLVAGLNSKKKIDEELNLLQKHAISWISTFDATYPALLKEIHLPPIGLYVQGAELIQFNKYFAIVGARKAHEYAHAAISHFVPSLIQNDWTIVSGGACGADSFAHISVLEGKGSTVAVLGSGLLCLYPSQNTQLFSRIIEQGGALVSPFPLMAKPVPGNFPARNRIISGLSRGCLVVQAAKKSGALITAEHALKEGREVFAVPGRIDDPLSAGCHYIIQQGAKLVHSVNDILEEIEENYRLKTNIQTNEENTASASIALNYTCTMDEHIIALCKTPCSIDELGVAVKKNPQELYEIVFNLHIQGRLFQNMAGLWYS